MTTKISKIGKATILAVFLICDLCTLVAGGTPSKIAQYDTQASTVQAHGGTNIGDILLLKGDVVTKPFQRVINKLVRMEKSVCDVEAELRLVTACRSMDGNAASSPSELRSLEAIKSLYGIRKSLCETTVSGTHIPESCRDLIPSTTLDMSQKQLTYSELELARSGRLSVCLRELQKHHYFWTSYSNNLQDAKDVLHLVRSDVELRALVNNYRDFEASVDDFRKDFEAMHNMASTWNHDATKKAELFAALQEEAFLNLYITAGNLTSLLDQLRQASDTSMHQFEMALKVLLSKATENFSIIAKETQSISSGISSMKQAMGDMYSSAALELASFTASEREALSSLLSSVEGRIIVLGKPIKDIELSLETLSSNISEVLRLQESQISTAQKQMEITHVTLDLQNASNQFAQQLHTVLENSLSMAEDFGSVVTAFSYLVELIAAYEAFIVMISVYVALCIVLAPLDGVVVPRGIVAKIKTGYVVLQATIFLLRQLEPLGKLNKLVDLIEAMFDSLITSQARFVMLTLIMTICIVIVMVTRSRTKRASAPERQLDLETAPTQAMGKGCLASTMSESQHKRIRSISRETRHSTSPPGL